MTRTDRAREFVQGGHGSRLAVEMAFALANFAAREVAEERKRIAERLKNICGEVGRSSVVDCLSELNGFIEELEAK